MLGQFDRFRGLDNATAIHDRDAVGQIPHDCQIVRDEQDRQTELALDITHEIEDASLNGGIQRGGDLVRHQDGRSCGKGPRKSHPLALATRQIPWEVLRMPGIQLHLLQQPADF